jgi:gliding motility-associated-like protein
MRIKRAYFTLALLSVLISSGIRAQIILSQQVIGSAGTYQQYANIYNLSFTIGEAVINTASSPSYIITQGIHQPTDAVLLSFELNINDASCPTSSDGSASIFNVSGCSPPFTIIWSTGEQGASINRLLPGAYTVLVQSSQCSRLIEFEIGAGPEEFCVLQFFNAFSPNDDGVNDVWEIENIARPEFADNSVEIFNRWGELVWSGSGYNNSDVVWNGNTSAGNVLPDGTYFYLVRISNMVFKGFIDLSK